MYNVFFKLILNIVLCFGCTLLLSAREYHISEKIENIPGLLCYWDFEGENPFLSKGKYAYELQNGNHAVEVVNDGPVLGKSILIKEGQYLFIPRSECPGLNLHGKDAQVTVLAWVKRQPKSYVQCEAIAGMWNETEDKRQYCLFLNIKKANQVSGHVSGLGGPTPGNRWCFDVALAKSVVNYGVWTFAGFTYNGKEVRAYHNGNFEAREGDNPYAYELGLFDGGKNGSDFTVGAVHRLGEMGNYFVGQIGFIAVFDRALSNKEIADIYKATQQKNDK